MEPASRVDIIRTESVLLCPLCSGEEHSVLHAGLKDYLFGAPGEWAFKKCRRCSLVFLDPRPVKEDVWKVYANYYTHFAKEPSNSPLSRLRRYIHGGYLAIELGYTEKVSPIQRLFGRVAYLHPEEQEAIKSSVMYLSSKSRGRVLDLGCGPGETLREMRRLGWEVEGVDFDPKVIEAAERNYGLKVRLGTLGDQNYPPNSFDAIGMSHVIEHVQDPVALLSECRRILKPGGRVIVATPNVDSLGHRYLRASWAPLVPPSHLWLYSRKTLARVAQEAGLRRSEIKTTVRGAYGIAIESRRIYKAQPTVGQPPGSVMEKIRGHVYQYIVSGALKLRQDNGEELLMTAIKEG